MSRQKLSGQMAKTGIAHQLANIMCSYDSISTTLVSFERKNSSPGQCDSSFISQRNAGSEISAWNKLTHSILMNNVLVSLHVAGPLNVLGDLASRAGTGRLGSIHGVVSFGTRLASSEHSAIRCVPRFQILQISSLRVA